MEARPAWMSSWVYSSARFVSVVNLCPFVADGWLCQILPATLVLPCFDTRDSLTVPDSQMKLMMESDVLTVVT